MQLHVPLMFPSCPLPRVSCEAGLLYHMMSQEVDIHRRKEVESEVNAMVQQKNIRTTKVRSD